MTKKIVQNSVVCDSCGEEVWSSSVHDFRYCSCGKIAVDGGMDYLRRVGDGKYNDTSYYMEDNIIEDIKKAVKWGKDTGRNDLGIALAVFRALRKHGLIKE